MADKSPPQYYQGDGVRGKDLLTFDEVSTIERVGSHKYKAHVHQEWSYGSSGHGGFLICLIWKTIQTHFETTLQKYGQPDIVAFHIEFLRPTAVGDITITLKDVRLGRATSVVHATLTQQNSEKCVVYATNAGPQSALNSLTLPMGYGITPPIPAIDFTAALANKDPHWVRCDIGRDPAVPNHALANVIFCHLRFPPETDEGRRTSTQWICPRIPEMKWTNATLGILFDHNVPNVENWYEDAPHNYYNMPKRTMRSLEEGGGTYVHPPWASPRFYPTVSMSIEVKRQLPAEGEKWLLAHWHTREVVEGRFDVSAEVWDSKRRLIAVAQSIWYVVDVSAASGSGSSFLEKSGRLATLGKGSKI